MDISIDMLSIAAQKTNQVNWLEGDMTDFDLNKNFSLITIFCDSLNYLFNKDEVAKTFDNVYRHLENDGVFLFDVHTRFKMETLFNNQNYIDEDENTFLAWEAIRGEEPLSVYHELSFFKAKDDGLYYRFNESHYQRTFDESEYIQLLKQSGFHSIETFLDFDFNNHDKNGERLFFIVKK